MSKITAFIALWDKTFGAKIIDFYPKSSQSKFDLEFIASKIFFAFQNLNEGDRVTFDIEQGTKGPAAVNVTVA